MLYSYVHSSILGESTSLYGWRTGGSREKGISK